MVARAGWISVAVEQSDKLGFDWNVYAVNDVVVRKDYVEQKLQWELRATPSYGKMARRLIRTSITRRTASGKSGQEQIGQCRAGTMSGSWHFNN